MIFSVGKNLQNSKKLQLPSKQLFNPWYIKIIYIVCIILISIYWNSFINIPVNCLAWAAVLWILNLYRTLNVDKTSIQNEFFIAFWVRMGWATSFSFYSTGKLYSDRAVFATTIIQCFIATSIYTALPLDWVQRLWRNRIYRWSIFFIDQIYANGLSFNTLLRKEIFGGRATESALIVASKATARPVFQIITGFFNRNLFWKNFKKWSTICYLNTGRMFLLWGINYVVVYWGETGRESMEILQYFNVCYYGFVGYLMYLQTYTL